MFLKRKVLSNRKVFLFIFEKNVNKKTFLLIVNNLIDKKNGYRILA